MAISPKMKIFQSAHPRIFNILVLSFITRRFFKKRKLVIFAITIATFFLINSGGAFAASATSDITSSLSHKGTVCCDSVVLKEYKIAKLKEDVTPVIKIITPHGGAVWTEGETYEIRWESQGIDAVYISVAVGGKDKGLLEENGNNTIDTRQGKIAWQIPIGFVTGFGISQSEQVRIMILDAHDNTIRDLSGYFTIEGVKTTAETVPTTQTVLRSQEQDNYIKAIIQYYEAIARRQYREAYQMLGQCKIVLYDADGSAVAFQPRYDYESWLKAHQNIDELTIIEVKRYQRGGDPLKYTADNGDAEATLGICTYMMTLTIKLHEENWTIKSGRNSLLVTVVKGTDGKIRILGIGTGP